MHVLSTLGCHPLAGWQTLALNRVLDGMERKLTTANWAAIYKALGDIYDLLARGVRADWKVEGGIRRKWGGGNRAVPHIETAQADIQHMANVVF
mgnify:CR=1 FL=1